MKMKQSLSAFEWNPLLKNKKNIYIAICNTILTDRLPWIIKQPKIINANQDYAMLIQNE